MKLESPEGIKEHNAKQRSYFEETGQVTLKPTGSPYLRRHVEVMMKSAGIRAGDRVLEIGCGMGRYTLILAEKGVKVEGLDLTEAVLEKLADFNVSGPPIPVHVMDILDCPATMYGQYDAVIGFFVLHHLHDLPACFETMGRLVKPGGKLCFIEPNPFSPLYYIQIFLTPGMVWAQERGLLRMRPTVMGPIMRNAGLAQVNFKRFGFFPPFIINRPLGMALEGVLEKVPIWRKMLPFFLSRGVRTHSSEYTTHRPIPPS